jgi:hypothetical protein
MFGPYERDVIGGMNATHLGTRSFRGVHEHLRCCQEIHTLTIENRRLRDELARARARQDDLTQSAEIWIRLYEAHLARARQQGISCSTPPATPQS